MRNAWLFKRCSLASILCCLYREVRLNFGSITILTVELIFIGVLMADHSLVKQREKKSKRCSLPARDVLHEKWQPLLRFIKWQCVHICKISYQYFRITSRRNKNYPIPQSKTGLILLTFSHEKVEKIISSSGTFSSSMSVVSRWEVLWPVIVAGPGVCNVQILFMCKHWELSRLWSGMLILKAR